MGKQLRRVVVASFVVVATVAAMGGRAEAAAPPTFTGGQGVAPYSGNFEPAVASNGTDTLVVWERGTGQGGLADIYGRITSADTTTIGQPFRISLSSADEYNVDVAWSGSVWLVVWQRSASGGDIDVRGRRVSAQGQLLGSELPIANGPAVARTPTVAGGPNGQFGVAWQDRRDEATTQEDIYVRRINASGGLLDGGGIDLADESAGFSTDDSQPDMAWNGQRYAIVFESLYDESPPFTQINGGSLLSNGATQYHGTVAGAASNGTRFFNVSAPAIAASGRSFYVAWLYEDPGFSGAPKVHGGVWDPLGGSPTAVRISSTPGDQSDPAVAGNGGFMVVWTDRRNGSADLWGARVATNGTVQDPNGFVVTEFYPENGYAALTKATSAAQTFTLAFESVPAGQSNGVVAYGVEPAPK